MSYVMLNIDPVPLGVSIEYENSYERFITPDNSCSQMKIEDPDNPEFHDVEELEEDEEFDCTEFMDFTQIKKPNQIKKETKIKKAPKIKKEKLPVPRVINKGLTTIRKSYKRNKLPYERDPKDKYDGTVKVYSFSKNEKIEHSLGTIKSQYGKERSDEQFNDYHATPKKSTNSSQYFEDTCITTKTETETQKQYTFVQDFIDKKYNNFEDLPEGWIKIIDRNGKSSYLHQASRVCTDSRPYYLGPGTVKKNQIEFGNILSEIRSIKDTLLQQQKLLDGHPRSHYTAIHNIKDLFPAKTMQELYNMEDRVNHDLGFKENIILFLKKELGSELSLDRALNMIATDDVYMTCNFTGKYGKNGLNDLKLFTEVLFDTCERTNYNQFGQDIYQCIKRAQNRFHKKMARKKVIPKRKYNYVCD